MKSRESDPVRYHKSSPSALNGLPRSSDRLKRARGLIKRRVTPSRLERPTARTDIHIGIIEQCSVQLDEQKIQTIAYNFQVILGKHHHAR